MSLIKELRNLLKSKTIAKNYKKWNKCTYDEDYIRQVIAGHKGTVTRDVFTYEVAWQVLFAIKEWHHNYTLSQDSYYNKTWNIDQCLSDMCEDEWETFLKNNIS